MLETLFLLSILLIPSIAEHYDDDKNYNRDDYDDAWEEEGIEMFKNESHRFVHKNVPPTKSVEKKEEKRGYLKRLRRETSSAQESYDDSWMNQLLEREDEDESADANYYEQLELLEVAARQEEAGVIEDVRANVKYSLGKTLEPGDYVEVYGTYSSDTNWFSVNFIDNSDNILLHVNPRRNQGRTVMNNKMDNKWQSAISLEFPTTFKHGENFKITIVLLDYVYKIYVDDKPLSETFPYRLPLSTAQWIELWGGSAGFTWNRIKVSGEESH